jgi:hypothetical protein
MSTNTKKITIGEAKAHRRLFLIISGIAFLFGVFQGETLLTSPFHELGHYWASIIQGYDAEVKEIDRMWSAAPFSNFLVAVSGTVMDRISAVVFMVIFFSLRWDWVGFLFYGSLLGNTIFIQTDLYMWCEASYFRVQTMEFVTIALGLAFFAAITVLAAPWFIYRIMNLKQYYLRHMKGGRDLFKGQKIDFHKWGLQKN